MADSHGRRTGGAHPRPTASAREIAVTVSALFEPLTLLHGAAMRNRFMTAPLTSQ